MIILTIFVLFSANVFANQVGNGGDVVSCPGKTPKTVPLDYYEAENDEYEIDFQIDLGGDDLTYMDKVYFALDRLKKVDPLRAERYRLSATEYHRDALENPRVLKPGIILEDEPDSEHTQIPAGCEVLQIALFRDPPSSSHWKYKVSKDLWDALDSKGKAGVILHEVVYMDAKKTGHTNSIKTRLLNSWISSANLDNIAPLEYLSLIKEVSIGKSPLVANGVLIQTPNFELDAEGHLVSATLAEDSEAEVLGERLLLKKESVVKWKDALITQGSLKSKASISIRDHEIEIYGDFIADGESFRKVDFISPKGGVKLLAANNYSYWFDDSFDLEFNREGKVINGYVYTNKEYPVVRYRIFGDCIWTEADNPFLDLYENGTLRRGSLKGSPQTVCLPPDVASSQHVQAHFGHWGLDIGFFENGVPAFLYIGNVFDFRIADNKIVRAGKPPSVTDPRPGSPVAFHANGRVRSVNISYTGSFANRLGKYHTAGGTIQFPSTVYFDQDGFFESSSR